MAELEYTLKINPDVINVLNNQAIQAGLEAVGMVLEGQVVRNITTIGIVDSGRLRNSITYKTKTKQKGEGLNAVPADNEVLIGTNVNYAPYLEFGTGIYAEGGGGRQTPWIYFYNGRKGERGFRFTRGIRPYAFLRKAMDQWRAKISDVFAASYKKVVDSQK